MTNRTWWRRRGMAAMEVVLATGVSFPLAGALYWLYERSIDQFFFAFGNSVGWPYF